MDADRTRLTYAVDTPEYGGAEAYVGRLIRHVPTRFAPTLLATRPVPEALRAAVADAGATLVEIAPVAGKRDLRGFAAMARALRATRPALVHVNASVATNNRHVLAAAVVLRLRAVATLHSVLPIPSPRQAALLRRLYPRLRAVVAVSSNTRGQLCEELGVADSDVALVPNGVERREPATLRDSRPVRIGSVGRLSDEKGFDVLVEATRRAVATGAEIEVAVAGEGEDLERLRGLSEGLPVRFLGWVEDREEFLRSIDVFCLPSRQDGLPFTLLEAMMAGLPCVASAVGDVGLALGPAGVVVPPDDPASLAEALAGVADSPERRRELAAAARARAEERYSVERMVDATVEVYDRVLTGSTPPRRRQA